MGEAIPARLATTSDGRIHYIIGDKEVGLQLDNIRMIDLKSLSSESEITTYKLDRPAQYTSFEVLVIGQLTTFQNLYGVNDRHAAIEFTTSNIVIEILYFFSSQELRRWNKCVHRGTIPLPLEAYLLQQNAQSTHL